MNNLNSQVPLTEDDKHLAASAAARAERQNKPVVYLAGACFALAVALVWAMLSWSAFAAARKSLVAQQSQAEMVIKNASAVRTLTAMAAADNGPELGEEKTEIRSELMQVGVASGLVQGNMTARAFERNTQRAPGSVFMTAAFDARDESLQPLMGWLERAVAQIPGLEVYKVTIKPEAQTWYMQVTFSRWEKPETKK